MRKILIAALALLAFAVPAKADTLSSFNPSPESTAAVTVTSGMSVAAIMGSMVGGVTLATLGGGTTALMYVISSGFDPWTPNFPSVEYSYPVKDFTNGRG